MPKDNWYLVTSHGAALFYIVLHAGCTADEIAQAMPLSRRRTLQVLSDLCREDMVHVRKQGRRSFYTVNSGVDFRHPKMKRYRLPLPPAPRSP